MKNNKLIMFKVCAIVGILSILSACSNSNKTFIGKTYCSDSSTFYVVTAKFINENECNINIEVDGWGSETYMMYYKRGRTIDPKIQMYFSEEIELLKDGERSWVSFETYRKELNTWDASFKDFAILLYNPDKDELVFIEEDKFDAVFYNEWYEALENGETYEQSVMDCIQRTETIVCHKIKL